MVQIYKGEITFYSDSDQENSLILSYYHLQLFVSFHNFFFVKMLKSEITRVSGPATLRQYRSSEESSDEDTVSKRSRHSSKSSSAHSHSDDEKDDDRRPTKKNEREEGEISTKTTTKTATQTTVPAKTGGLYMPPAKLRLLQVMIHRCNEMNNLIKLIH